MFSFLAPEPQTFEDCLTQSFNVPPGGVFSIEADTGSAHVEPCDSNEVRVEVVRQVVADTRREADEKLKRLRVRFAQSGPDVKVDSAFRGQMSDLQLLFRVRLPRGCNLVVRTAAGHVTVEGLRGAADVETAAGSLRFTDVRGSILGRTLAGNVTVADAEGPVNVRTSGGSINVARVTGTLNLRTGGGGIRVDEPAGAVSATAGGGNVEVCLRPSASFEVDAETSAGRVVAEFPPGARMQGAAEASLRAVVGDGGPLLRLRTSGGDIFLRRL
jgi:DUF4097 and DUF4098 domain-containing protein YvlB